LLQDGLALRRFGLPGSRLRMIAILLGLAFMAQAMLLVGLTWLAYSHHGNDATAVVENVRLRSHLQDIERRQVRADQTLDRVMTLNETIRRLTTDDRGVRNFEIEPLSLLQNPSAARTTQTVALATDITGAPGSGESLSVYVDNVELRTQELLYEVVDAEQSLEEVRGYLDDRISLLHAFPSLWPVRGWLTSGYGWRRNPILGSVKLHAGLDIAAPRGTPVVAPADGDVVFAGSHSAYGNLLVIDHGYGITTKYAHTSVLLVDVGERVHRGELLARVGSTGQSTGPHLHFEIHKNGSPLNPIRFLVYD